VQVGTRFIATAESGAPAAYKQALLNAQPEDVVYTPEVTGVPANFLRSSLERLGEEGSKPWKDVWSAGHGVAQIRDLPPAAELVARLAAEYQSAKGALP